MQIKKKNIKMIVYNDNHKILQNEYLCKKVFRHLKNITNVRRKFVKLIVDVCQS